VKLNDITRQSICPIPSYLQRYQPTHWYAYDRHWNSTLQRYKKRKQQKLLETAKKTSGATGPIGIVSGSNVVNTGSASNGQCMSYSGSHSTGQFNVLVGEGSFNITHMTGEVVYVRNLGANLIDIVNVKGPDVKALAMEQNGNGKQTNTNKWSTWKFNCLK
jgi:hypothetical protein